jgi:hypothetical protein
LHLAGSNGLAYNLFLCVSAVISYGLSGWVTGLVLTFSFNVIAKQTGGIDAKHVITTTVDCSTKHFATHASNQAPVAKGRNSL